MRKQASLALIFLLTFSLFSFAVAMEEDDDNSNSGSDSEEEDSSGSSNSEIKSLEEEFRERKGGLKDSYEEEYEELKEEYKERIGELKERERHREELREHKEKGEFEYESDYRTEDGRRIKIKIHEKMEDGITKRKIEYEERSLDFETKLKLREHFNETSNETFFVVNISNGSEQRIRIIPERLYDVALERLESKNFTVEVIEETDRRVPRVVYHLRSDHHGRFIGLWKIKARYEASVDPETGEVIDSRAPWWAFLITGDAPEDLLGDDNNQTDSDDDNETDDDNNQTDIDLNETETDDNQTDTNQTEVNNTNLTA